MLTKKGVPSTVVCRPIAPVDRVALLVLTSHVKKWPNCWLFGIGAKVSYTSALVPNCPDILDPSRWCRSVLGPKCLRSEVSVHHISGMVLCCNFVSHFSDRNMESKMLVSKSWYFWSHFQSENANKYFWTSVSVVFVAILQMAVLNYLAVLNYW